MGSRKDKAITSLAMYGAYMAGIAVCPYGLPTEILAEQAFQSLKGTFSRLKVVLLTSGMKMADKKVALSKNWSLGGSNDCGNSLTDSGCGDLS